MRNPQIILSIAIFLLCGDLSFARPTTSVVVDKPKANTEVTKPNSKVQVTRPSSAKFVTKPIGGKSVIHPKSSTAVTKPTEEPLITKPTSSVSVTHPSTTVEVVHPTTNVDVVHVGETNPFGNAKKEERKGGNSKMVATSSSTPTSMSDYKGPVAKDFKATQLGKGDGGLGGINEAEKDAAAASLKLPKSPEASEKGMSEAKVNLGNLNKKVEKAAKDAK